MDSLKYYYPTSGGRLSNNKLNYITDKITIKTWPYGLDNQAVNNYTYDAIGNMTADVVDTISNINWTVYGKIQNLTNSKGTITYSYDPAGQRVTSTASGVTTYYIRDAQGNTLAMYNNQGGYTYLKEQDLYGSSRLGLWQPNIRVGVDSSITTYDTIGRKQYELSNHLGNVMATVTDKRIAHDSGDHITADYYLADVATAKEYYAFGGLMPGRTFDEDTTYRYGFNGKENDNDVKGIGNQQDYGMRIYDPRVGRFLSVDPLDQTYPWWSSYQFAGNMPIKHVDKDGLEVEEDENLVDWIEPDGVPVNAHLYDIYSGREPFPESKDLGAPEFTPPNQPDMDYPEKKMTLPDNMENPKPIQKFVHPSKLTDQDIIDINQRIMLGTHTGQDLIYQSEAGRRANLGLTPTFNGYVTNDKDGLTGRIANKISQHIPFSIFAVERIIYKDNGDRLTDFDIELTNHVIEITAGGGKGKVGQILEKIKPNTNKEVILYAPNLKGSVEKEAKKAGIKVFRREDDLVNYLNDSQNTANKTP